MCVLLLFFLAAQRFLPSQVKQEELEELNKELRQCNLQQFIQQTGVLPAHTHSRTGLQEQLEQLELAHLLQDGYNNRGVESKPTEKTSWNDRIVEVSCINSIPLRRVAASPHCQAVPRTPAQPSKPSCVQSQPRGCVCVRPSRFAPLPPCPPPGPSALPGPKLPPPASLGLTFQVFFFGVGWWKHLRGEGLCYLLAASSSFSTFERLTNVSCWSSDFHLLM